MHFKVLAVMTILLIGIISTTQSALAQIDDPSRGRVLGIGLLWPTLDLRYYVPTILSVRMWLGDFLGLEGLFTMISISAGPAPVSILAGGAGVLLKIINIPFVDLYTAGRVMVVRPEIPSYIATEVPYVIAWFVATGLEVAPVRFFAVSFETTFFTSFDVAIPGTELGSLRYSGFFPPVLGVAIHLYF